MGKVLGIVYRAIATHLIHKAGFTKTTAQTGAVTLIQRFGGALNANIHIHMLFLDRAYSDSTHGSHARFRWVQAPTSDELTQLTHTIAQRVARYLERQGFLVRLLGSSANDRYVRADFLHTTPPGSDRMVLLDSVRTDAPVETPGFLFGERKGLRNEQGKWLG